MSPDPPREETKEFKWTPILENDLKIVFVGFNPGTRSALTSHYYAHPSNRFWKMLYMSKFTPKVHKPEDDLEMPLKYGIGFTDLVSRTTKRADQLTISEKMQGAVMLESRIKKYKPRAVCFVGKGIFETVAKLKGWKVKEFKYGQTNLKFGQADLFCVPSTSGINSIKPETQLKYWQEVYSNVE